MMTVLVIDHHCGIGLGHVVDLIFGNRVDLHLVEHFHEASEGCLRSGFDDDDRFLQIFILSDL